MGRFNQPPKLAQFLLKAFCREDYLDEILGDLEETFHWRMETKGRISASFRYYLDVLSAIRFSKAVKTVNAQFVSGSMLRSFGKSALRNFRRHLSYTFLNVFGLALGMAAALIILEYVSDELNYNTSDQSEDIYRVSNDYYRNGGMIYEGAFTFSGVGPAMAEEISGIESFGRMTNNTMVFSRDIVLSLPHSPEANYKESHVYFADPTIPNYFDLKLIAGSSTLKQPNQILLSRELAEKYFGSVESAIGEQIDYADDWFSFELTVGGVYDLPDFNLQVQMDALISYETKTIVNPERFENDWGANDFLTFAKLEEGTDPSVIEGQLEALALKYKPSYNNKNEQGEYIRKNRFFLMNIADIHLESNYQNDIGRMGNPQTLNLLQLIAFFIVLIAWINFINLTTARSVSRTKEVGVRKVMGSKRHELVAQFFTEALLINLFALALGICIVFVVQSPFNAFVEKELSLEVISLGKFGGAAITIFALGTFLSGIYPAMSLSSHKTILALKGRSKSKGNGALRKGLIVFQLTFSTLLIIGTFAMHRQMSFMNSQHLGFDSDKVLVLNGGLGESAFGREEDSLDIQKIGLFKERLRALPGVESAGAALIVPGKGILRGIAIATKQTENASDIVSIERVEVDNGFFPSLNMNFVAGTPFNEHMNDIPPIILNVSAVKALGLTNPQEAIGQVIYEFGRAKRKVVGVIQDYHHESLNREKEAMYFVRNEAISTYYVVRLGDANTQMVIADIEALFESTFERNPADYYFLSSFFDRQYRADHINSSVFTGFSIMAIIVACLGLYGLSSFTAMQRTKEIGVRKVLGAKAYGLFFMLTKEVLTLGLIAFVIALPLAVFLIRLWLNGFAYHFTPGVMEFVLPFLLVLVITVIAISQKVIQTATSDPVRSLRYE